MKKLLLLFLTFCTCHLFAGQSGEKEYKTIEGKKFVVYHAQSGDGWNSIAKKFGISYAELRVANKNSDDKLEIGQEILIPAGKLKANDPFYQKNYTDEKGTTTKEETIYHIVKSSQTLFGISKMYKISVDDIKEWNNLKSNSISVGQKLIVGKKIVSSVVKSEINTPEVKDAPKETPKQIIVEKPASKTVKAEDKIDEQDDDPEPEPKKATPKNASVDADIVSGENSTTELEISDDKIVFAKGRREVSEKGKAIWNEDEENATEKYYAYHRTAPLGTIIRITNVTNSNKIYVRVSGVLSDSHENDDVLIRISKAGAEKLGATEKSFKVELLYGINKEN